MIEILKQPWPWYVAGAIIGLIVPALLILGNKHFGISAKSPSCMCCMFSGGYTIFLNTIEKGDLELLFRWRYITGRNSSSYST